MLKMITVCEDSYSQRASIFNDYMPNMVRRFDHGVR
jgi:hypothetical protein